MVFQIQQKLQRQTTFNDSLNNLSWRVDMKAISKSTSDVDALIASFEMDLACYSSNSKGNQIVKFDMSREEVGDMIDTLSQIQQTLDSLTANNSTGKT